MSIIPPFQVMILQMTLKALQAQWEKSKINPPSARGSADVHKAQIHFGLLLTALCAQQKKAEETIPTIIIPFSSWKGTWVYAIRIVYFHQNSVAWPGDLGRKQKLVSLEGDQPSSKDLGG